MQILAVGSIGYSQRLSICIRNKKSKISGIAIINNPFILTGHTSLSVNNICGIQAPVASSRLKIILPDNLLRQKAARSNYKKQECAYLFKHEMNAVIKRRQIKANRTDFQTFFVFRVFDAKTPAYPRYQDSPTMLVTAFGQRE